MILAKNKLGVLPEGLLNKLRLFIKHNSYGQYIALLLMSITAIYITLLYMDIINKGPLRVVLTTILQLFDIIFALSIMFMDWDPLHFSLLVFVYYTYWQCFHAGIDDVITKIAQNFVSVCKKKPFGISACFRTSELCYHDYQQIQI